MVEISEIRFLLLKFISGVVAVVLCSSSLRKLMEGADYYEQKLVCGYNVPFSALIICAEFSPYVLENYLIQSFPFLSTNKGKGLFYLVIASFCFDPQMGDMGYIAAQLLFVSGIGWIIHHYIEEGSIPCLGSSQSKGMTIGGVSNASSGIDFGKYMDKRPKAEQYVQETCLQDLSSYNPPLIKAQYKNNNEV